MFGYIICGLFLERRFKPNSDRYWTDFENAATYGYARTIVEKDYRYEEKTSDST
jgi:hypothetical protein